jgi:hypothetical protein
MRMSWKLRKLPTGIPSVKGIQPQPVEPIKPVRPVRPVKPVAPVGYEYYWDHDKKP